MNDQSQQDPRGSEVRPFAFLPPQLRLLFVAALDPVAIPTLSMLVAATVFSTTFLTNRVHRERGRAIDRALKLDEFLVNARREKKQLDADWFDEQRAVLEEPLRDRLGSLTLVMNIILALGTLWLAIAFGVHAQTDWYSPQGWGLAAFAATALLVMIVGVVDIIRARRSLSYRLGETTVGQIAKADRTFTRLAKRAERRKIELTRTAAEAAVRTSRGLYGPACEWLARVELISLLYPTRPDHLLNAGKWLDRAISSGPETAPMLAARAFVHEEFGCDALESTDFAEAQDAFQMAKTAWLRALALYSRGVERELRPEDPTVLGARERSRMTGQQGSVYGWSFRPRRPETLALTLVELPGLEQTALVTADLLARSAAEYPDVAQIAVDGLAAWLDQLTSKYGWKIADHLADRLAAATNIDLVKKIVAEARTDEGSIGRDRAVEAARRARNDEAFVKAERNLDELARQSERILAEMRQSAAEFSERELETLERRERIDRGEGTEDDLAWLKRLVEEAVAMAKSDTALPMLDEAEAMRLQFEEDEKAFEERQQQRDLLMQRDNDFLERALRRVKGRATERDLDEGIRLADKLLAVEQTKHHD